jgi:hypothetical protein
MRLAIFYIFFKTQNVNTKACRRIASLEMFVQHKKDDPLVFESCRWYPKHSIYISLSPIQHRYDDKPNMIDSVGSD